MKTYEKLARAIAVNEGYEWQRHSNLKQSTKQFKYEERAKQYIDIIGAAPLTPTPAPKQKALKEFDISHLVIIFDKLGLYGALVGDFVNAAQDGPVRVEVKRSNDSLELWQVVAPELMMPTQRVLGEYILKDTADAVAYILHVISGGKP